MDFYSELKKTACCEAYHREYGHRTSRYGIAEETFDNCVGIVDDDEAVSGNPTDDSITDSVRGTEKIFTTSTINRLSQYVMCVY